MAKTETVKITYKGSVKPAKTTFLAPAEINMDFEGTLDLVDSDIANAKAVQKAFQAEMDSRLKAQLAALNAWLAEKDHLIADMVKRGEELKKAPQPATLKQHTDLARIAEELDPRNPRGLVNEWLEMVANWAINAKEQQALVAMKLAVKTARIKAYTDKAFRVRAAQAAKAILVVSVVAVGVAAFVLSLGTAAPVVVGLHAAGLSVAGLGNMAKLGVTLAEDFTMEKHILGNLARDVLTIRQALSEASAGQTGIAKHVTELKNLIAKREDTIRALKVDTAKFAVEVKAYDAEAGADGPDAARRKKAVAAIQAGLQATERKIRDLEAKNALGEALLHDLADMVGDLGRISTQPGETFIGNLKTWLGKPDEAAGLVATLGILTNVGAGLGHR